MTAGGGYGRKLQPSLPSYKKNGPMHDIMRSRSSNYSSTSLQRTLIVVVGLRTGGSGPRVTEKEKDPLQGSSVGWFVMT